MKAWHSLLALLGVRPSSWPEPTYEEKKAALWDEITRDYRPGRLEDCLMPNLVIGNDERGEILCTCVACRSSSIEVNAFGRITHYRSRLDERTARTGVFGCLPDDLGQMRGGKVTS